MKFVTKDIASAMTDENGVPIDVEPGQESTVKSIWGPIVVVGVVTYLTASLLLGLFDQAVMALNTCLCVDVDTRDDGQPYYGPETFHDNYKKIVDPNHKKKSEEEGGANDMA